MSSQWELAVRLAEQYGRRLVYLAEEARWVWLTDAGEVESVGNERIYACAASAAMELCREDDVPSAVRADLLSSQGLQNAIGLAALQPGLSTVFCSLQVRRSKLALCLLLDRLASVENDGKLDAEDVHPLEALLLEDDREAWETTLAEAHVQEGQSEARGESVH